MKKFEIHTEDDVIYVQHTSLILALRTFINQNSDKIVRSVEEIDTEDYDEE